MMNAPERWGIISKGEASMKIEKFFRCVCGILALAFGVGMSGCGGDDSKTTTTTTKTDQTNKTVVKIDRTPPLKTHPRTFIHQKMDDIFQERRSVGKLYLTGKTLRKIFLTGNVSAPFVDEETGELCWRALICTNPKCPKQGKEYFFVHDDPLVTVGFDGQPIWPEVGEGQDYGQLAIAAGGFPDPTCPACYEKFRKGKQETQVERQRYANYVKEYETPEAAKKREELDRKG